MMTQKEIVANGMKALFQDFDPGAMHTWFDEGYIQHNPHVPTGLGPILGLLPALKAANFQYTTHRMFSDGDLVVTHNTGHNAMAFGSERIVTFDLWRVQDGRIAEHWDAIIPFFPDTASGRSQTDGPTEATDLGNTDHNKALIGLFMRDILMGENPSKITDYINAEHYHQHNPQIKDGLDGLMEAIQVLTAADNMFQYHNVHRVIGEGNFVLAQSEGAWHGKPHVFYDLFRIEDGQLVEHWDVIQEIPEKMAHSNTMF